MKPLTGEWVTKAEADFISAQRECRARKNPNYDLVGFLAQQCAEKYLKARLQEAGFRIEKTHNLLVLLEQCLAFEPLWEPMRTSLSVLSNYAVAFRYPGEQADKVTAKDALRIVTQIRAQVRAALGLAD